MGDLFSTVKVAETKVMQWGYQVQIGSRANLMEMLAAIIQQFRLTTLADPPVVPEPSFTLRPKYGIKMLFEARGQVT